MFECLMERVTKLSTCTTINKNILDSYDEFKESKTQGTACDIFKELTMYYVTIMRLELA